MDEQALKRQLETSGLPVTYRQWPIGQAPPLPWCVYYYNRNNNFYADGRVYHQFQRYIIELYCKRKDPAAEEKLEKALAPFVWTKAEIDLPEDKMVMIIYEIET